MYWCGIYFDINNMMRMVSSLLVLILIYCYYTVMLITYTRVDIVHAIAFKGGAYASHKEFCS